jgi:putative FmdB family regulatory protein
MPLYDFKCPKCGLVFVVSRPMRPAPAPALGPSDATASERLWRATIIIGGSGSSDSEGGGDGGLGGLGDFGGDDHGHSHAHGHDHFH